MTSQVAMKAGFHEGSVAQVQSTTYIACYLADAIAGCLEPFDPEVKSVLVYMKRTVLCSEGDQASKCVPVLLNVIGRENFSLL